MRHTLNRRAATLILVFTFPMLAKASETQFDPQGRLQRIALNDGWLPLDVSIKIPVTGWAKAYANDDMKLVRADAAGALNWQMRLGGPPRPELEIIQSSRENGASLELDLKASALGDCDIEGVILWVGFPAAMFAGGTFEARGKDAQDGVFPLEKREPPYLSSGTLDSLTVRNAKKTVALTLALSPAVNVTLQDERKWGGQFGALVYIKQGAMAHGDKAQLRVVLTPSGTLETAPAEFTVSPDKPLGAFGGTGGNYCFEIQSAETHVTLEKLKPSFARTELSLDQWMPRKESGPDVSLSGKLRKELELMRELSQRQIPFVTSVWKAPKWMTEVREEPNPYNPAGPPNKNTHLRPDSVDSAIEAIASYLELAKKEYQAEPVYFSFNEPDCGAQIKFTPEEHADFVKRAAKRFEKWNMRMLLGDVCHARGSTQYLKPALADAEIKRICGAVAFHSWGGATPAQYEEWSKLAGDLDRPLLCLEAGVDSGAWQQQRYRQPGYASLEAAHYNDLFRYARPRNVLYWEYTADYSLMESLAYPTGRSENSPRFAVQRHWSSLIPKNAAFIGIEGTHPDVGISAFRGKNADGSVSISVNLSNTGWTRHAIVTGFPKTLRSLHVVVTSEQVQFTKRPDCPVTDGRAEIEVPKRSLLTLTTQQ